MKSGTFPLRRMLEAAARNDRDLARVNALLDPLETSRVLPLELTYRDFNGDRLPRRCRLWNTLGHLFLEGEHWDHGGGRFWREVVALCTIQAAGNLPIPSRVPPGRMLFAAQLRTETEVAVKPLHQHLRMQLHWEVEAELSALARTYPLGPWPALDTHSQSLPSRTRSDHVEIWVDARDLVETARLAAPLTKFTDNGDTRPTREILRESLSGHAGALIYTLVKNDSTPRHPYTLRETFQAPRGLDHEISWEYELHTPANRKTLHGVFIPMDTIDILIDDQRHWSHWSWAPSISNDDLGALCRNIHHSGDYNRLRQTLAHKANEAWHDAINAACKGDCLALIASCALHPRRNIQISRRLMMGHVRTSYFRLFYKGGVLVGTILKHAWAFGWGLRPVAASCCTGDLRAITGRKPGDLPAPVSAL